jgi:transposase-like protein
VLLRRLDVVTVIGAALVLKVIDGLGMRPIAEQVDVPLTTLRSWWQRFRVRSPLLLSTCTRLVVTLDGTPVEVRGVGERAAVEVLGLAWQRARAPAHNLARMKLSSVQEKQNWPASLTMERR